MRRSITAFAATMLLCGIAQGQSKLEPKYLPGFDLKDKKGVRIAHFGPGDHRRYGAAIAFTVMTESGSEESGYVFKSRHLAACNGSWSTDGFSNLIEFENSLKIRQAALPARDEHISTVEVLDGLAGLPDTMVPYIAANLQSWCAKAAGKIEDEIPVTMSRGTNGTVGYLLMRTVSKADGKTLAWFDYVGFKEESIPVAGADPVQKRSMNPRAETAKTRYSADCASQQLATLATIDYLPDGSVKDNFTASTPRYKQVAPNTVGETVLRFLCRL